MPKMLPALAHVPPAHVKASFELVIEKITDVIEREVSSKKFQWFYAEYFVALTELGKRFENAKVQICSRNCRIILLQTSPIRKKNKKKQMQNIRSTYEFENSVPYLRAVANFR